MPELYGRLQPVRPNKRKVNYHMFNSPLWDIFQPSNMFIVREIMHKSWRHQI